MNDLLEALHAMRRMAYAEERKQQGFEDPNPFKLEEGHLKNIAAAKFELIRLTVDTRFAVATALGKYGDGLLAAGLGPEHQDIVTVASYLRTSGSLAGLSDLNIFRACGWLKQFGFATADDDVIWAASAVAKCPEFIPWLRDFNPEQYKSAQEGV